MKMTPKEAFEAVQKEVARKVAGYDEIVKQMFIAIVADGHILLEGAPGLAKTTTSKAVADTFGAEFGRTQGTADLKINDIIGFAYLDDLTKEVKVKKGPIFTNIFLIDELNRMPPMTVTSMLQSLEEKEVTIGAVTFKLPKPFIAFATQNPLNIEGTIALPKVLTDRFLMRIGMNYAASDVEENMIRIKERGDDVKTEKVLDMGDVLELQEMAKKVTMSDDIVKLIVGIVQATRKDIHVVMGGSPRSEISFMKCAKAKALIEGRNQVSVDDIKYLARPVLSHRIAVRASGGLGVNGIIDGIVATIR